VNLGNLSRVHEHREVGALQGGAQLLNRQGPPWPGTCAHAKQLLRQHGTLLK
jgi:hypothetical protein